MAQEVLNQEQIDHLLRQIESGDEVDVTSVQEETSSVLASPKSRTMLAMIKRLEWARYNGSFEEVREARKFLHESAFENWLIKRKLDRREFYQLMNREAKRRGMKPPYPRYNYGY